MENEIITEEDIDINDILTFDEIIADPYYKAEFDKKVAEALNINNTHSEVKGGYQTMNEKDVQSNRGEEEPNATALPADASGTADNPTAEKTDTANKKAEQGVAREMTAEQFGLYNETLRRVSKTAKASLPNRYNAFEDAEIKAVVKQSVMSGEEPNVKELAASVVSRIQAQNEPKPETQPNQNRESGDEVQNLKAELALIKAGVVPERIEAAKKLFLSEGADFNKIGDFIAKYPEWQAQGGGVVFSKAPPVGKKTAPNLGGQPALNDFERKVAAARKKAGLE